ncbi:transporter [Sphaerisporangium siamense]|uniref:ABC-2 type transport system permease protein n=1 Tax=Sphaerisporangium siamense TaxID=795645 RepID=A0A7W7GDS5_9ACTN|nr:hypothetical protein [Sphaerisporangium siamense]MBB4705937.1 ABC-2 type transport system permease protein [Sphaerisporangium siamense]GII82668.1 transporter [Sphaerisporangium siamense]
MARLFIRLKLRLIAGNLRGDLMRQVGFMVTLAGALIVGCGGLLLMSLLRLAPPDVALDVGVVTFTGLTIVWIVAPLMAFGVDETLDPARLALFPLTPRQMAAGMFAASAAGPWPLASLLVLLGVVAGLARGVTGLLLGLVAVVLQGALCLVASRAVTTALSRLLRSRRGRDLLALGVVAVILLSQLPNLLLSRGYGEDARAMLAGLAGVVRWGPPGMAAHAIADGGPAGLAELAAVAVVVLALAWVWIRVLRNAMVTADASTQAGAVRGDRLEGLLPGGPLGAVVAKQLKYLRREPRGRMGWLAAVGVSAVIIFTTSGGAAEAMPTWSVVGPVCVAALMIGLQSANLFGVDGGALWMHALAFSTARELRTDLAGRQFAVALVGVPLLAVLSLAAALVAGDLPALLPALLAGTGLLLIGLGVGALVSVLLPYTFPERVNAFSGAAPGQGPLAMAGSFGAMTATGVLAFPVLLPVIAGVGWVAALGVAYGLGIAFGGRVLAASIGYDRLPEILNAVSRPA